MPTEVQIYKDGTIVEADIANNAVTTDKIGTGAVTPGKLSTGGPNWDTAGNLTASSFTGTATNATNAGISTNLKGGSIGAIPYQSSSNVTTFLNRSQSAAGTQVLSSTDGLYPSWRPLTGATATWGSSGNPPTTLVEFGNIPTWAREITLMFRTIGFRTNGASAGDSHLNISLQPASSFIQNKARSNSFFIQGGAGSGQVLSTDTEAITCYVGSPTNQITGQVTFKKFDNLTAGEYFWFATGNWTYSRNDPSPPDTYSGWVSGNIFTFFLPPNLPVTRVLLSPSNGADYFGQIFQNAGQDDARIQVSYQ